MSVDASGEQTSAPAKSRAGTVAKASGILMIALLMSRVLGQLRDTVISAQFGQNMETDIYRSAFALPDILFFLIAGGALSSAFVPVFSEYLAKGEDDEAWKVFSVIGTVMALVVSAFVVFTVVFARPLVELLRPSWTDAQLDQLAFLTRIVLPSQIAFFLGGLMFSTLYVRNHFIAPALGPVIYNIGIILGGLILSWALGMGIVGFALGALIGAFVGNFLIPLYTLNKVGIKYRWNLDTKHPGVRRVWKLMLPVIFGLSLPGVYGLVNGFFASFLQEGAVSALDQANRLMQAPLGIFGQSLALAVFPTLSMYAAQKNFDDYRDTLNRSLRNVFFLTIPVSVGFVVYSTEVVRVLFEYGKFTPEDTRKTALALMFYCIGIFAWSALAIIQRSFYALQDTRTPVILGTVTTLVFLPLSWALSMSMGHTGLAFATSLAAVGQMVWMLFMLKRRVGGIQGARLVQSYTKTLVAAAVMALVAWFTRLPITHLAERYGIDGRLEAVFVLLVSGGLGVAAFGATAMALKMEELAAAKNILRRRRRAS